MPKFLSYVLLLSIGVVVAGCTPQAPLPQMTGESSTGEQNATAGNSIAQQWHILNGERTDLNIFIPKDIPPELADYEITQTYSSKKQNAVLFALPDDVVGYTKETNAYIFGFTQQEKNAAILDISVASGEVEVRIWSTDLNNPPHSDYISVSAGEKKQIKLIDYFSSSPSEDEVQHLFIRATSSYAIFDYEISFNFQND